MEDERNETTEVTTEESTGHLWNGPENTIKLFANIILVLGIIATIICGATLIYVKKYEWVGYEFKEIREFSPEGIGITILVLLMTFVYWATFRIYVNVSLTLKSIYKKMK